MGFGSQLKVGFVFASSVLNLYIWLIYSQPDIKPHEVKINYKIINVLFAQ